MQAMVTLRLQTILLTMTIMRTVSGSSTALSATTWHSPLMTSSFSQPPTVQPQTFSRSGISTAQVCGWFQIKRCHGYMIFFVMLIAIGVQIIKYEIYLKIVEAGQIQQLKDG